jgi:pteridine reductase
VYSLRGKRALVTGAGTRVGQAIAIALGRAGMHVAVHYHGSREGAEYTQRSIEELGGRASLLTADLKDREQARNLVDEAASDLGGLDLLVPSAASFEAITYDELDDDAWDRSLLLNSATPFALAHRATPALRESRGAIVFITCASTTNPMRGYLPYVVSKAATKQLMRTLALELAPEIRVNAVAPGTVLPPPGFPEATLSRLVARIPLGRVGSAEDIAEAVVFLAEAPYITGQELTVDGGRTVAGLERSI